MKRKLFAILFAASMVMTMASGCKGSENTSVSAETVKEPVTAITFTGERSFTAIQGEAVDLSDLITDTEVETGFNPETVTIQYKETEFVIDMDADLPENDIVKIS